MIKSKYNGHVYAMYGRTILHYKRGNQGLDNPFSYTRVQLRDNKLSNKFVSYSTHQLSEAIRKKEAILLYKYPVFRNDKWIMLEWLLKTGTQDAYIF